MISLTIFKFFHDCVLMIHHYRMHLLIKNEIEQRLNSDMIKNYNLSTKWLVDFNPKKTKCMLFSTNQGHSKPPLLFNNEDVEFVENQKHLGVTFSSNC